MCQFFFESQIRSIATPNAILTPAWSLGKVLSGKRLNTKVDLSDQGRSSNTSGLSLAKIVLITKLRRYAAHADKKITKLISLRSLRAYLIPYKNIATKKTGYKNTNTSLKSVTIDAIISFSAKTVLSHNKISYHHCGSPNTTPQNIIIYKKINLLISLSIRRSITTCKVKITYSRGISYSHDLSSNNDCAILAHATTVTTDQSRLYERFMTTVRSVFLWQKTFCS